MCDKHVFMCYHCFRLNFSTMSCVCKLQSGVAMYDCPQSFRFVGYPISRPFIDVKIKNRTIPGLMNTSEIQSSIDETLAMFVLGLSMFNDGNVMLPEVLKVPIEINNTVMPLTCKIKRMEPGIHLHLAMDFHFFQPFDLSINNVTINSQKYWNTSHHEAIDYVYNHRRGTMLRRKLTDIGLDDFKIKTYRRF
ncbi:hypothetical protein ACFFRR_006950 [Megaselia abdita]